MNGEPPLEILRRNKSAIYHWALLPREFITADLTCYFVLRLRTAALSGRLVKYLIAGLRRADDHPALVSVCACNAALFAYSRERLNVNNKRFIDEETATEQARAISFEWN